MYWHRGLPSSVAVKLHRESVSLQPNQNAVRVFRNTGRHSAAGLVFPPLMSCFALVLPRFGCCVFFRKFLLVEIPDIIAAGEGVRNLGPVRDGEGEPFIVQLIVIGAGGYGSKCSAEHRRSGCTADMTMAAIPVGTEAVLILIQLPNLLRP